MTRKTYEMWLNYHKGLINLKDLSIEDKKEIRASEFAMDLLVPTPVITDLCIKHVGSLKNAQYNQSFIRILSDYFEVEKEVIMCKIDSLVNLKKDRYDKIEINHKKDPFFKSKVLTKKRIIKKEDNIIHVKF